MELSPALKRRKNRILTIPAVARSNQRGTALVEFILATGLLIVPMFLGIIMIGLSLILANQVTEVCRDTGHMYSYGVDFSQASSQLLVTNQLAQGLGMTPTGGKAIVYLSTITYVDATSCVAAGLPADTASCPNMNQTVVINRLTIGNTGIHTSSFAPAITPSIIGSNGNISSANYLTDPSVRAANFTTLINVTVGQYAYVSEMFSNPPVGGFWSLFSSNVVTARSIF